MKQQRGVSVPSLVVVLDSRLVWCRGNTGASEGRNAWVIMQPHADNTQTYISPSKIPKLQPRNIEIYLIPILHYIQSVCIRVL